MAKTHWGEGRIQILALKEEILLRLAKDHSYTEIHRDLVAEGKLSVALRTFHRHTSKYKIIIEDRARETDLKILYSKGQMNTLPAPQSGLKNKPFKHQPLPSDNDTDW